jgi:hypothetical protein
MTGVSHGRARRPSRYAGAPDRPVFIGGSPRSGTTLLRLMIDSSPDIGIPRETKVVVTVWEERRSFGDLSIEANRRRLADRIVETMPGPKSNRLGVLPPELHKRVLAAPPTLGSALGTCLAAYAEVHGKPRWGDKRPVYARYLDAVFGMYPDAQFIHLVRDPRAASASMAGMWYDGNIAPAVELWERSMRAVAPWRDSLAPDQFLELRYEDLVSDPRGHLEQIAAFLTMDPSTVDDMLQYHLHPDETSPVHPHVTQPPTTDNIDKWRALPENQIAVVERVAGEWMSRYGYEPAMSGVKPSAKELKRYHRRVNYSARLRRSCQRNELRLLLPPRRPVAARLTSSQRNGAKPVNLPPLWQRWIGRPP